MIKSTSSLLVSLLPRDWRWGWKFQLCNHLVDSWQLVPIFQIYLISINSGLVERGLLWITIPALLILITQEMFKKLETKIKYYNKRCFYYSYLLINYKGLGALARSWGGRLKFIFLIISQYHRWVWNLWECWPVLSINSRTIS